MFHPKVVGASPHEDRCGELPMRLAMQARLYPVLAFAVVLMYAAIGCDSNPTGPSADFAAPSFDGGHHRRNPQRHVPGKRKHAQDVSRGG